jgi:hypothetical protein
MLPRASSQTHRPHTNRVPMIYNKQGGFTLGTYGLAAASGLVSSTTSHGNKSITTEGQLVQILKHFNRETYLV